MSVFVRELFSWIDGHDILCEVHRFCKMSTKIEVAALFKLLSAFSAKTSDSSLRLIAETLD